MHKSILFLVLLSLAGSACAFEPVRVNRLKPGQLEQLAEMIESGMQPGGSYAHVTAEQQADVRKAMSRIARLLPEGTAVADLNDAQKVELFNAQSEVNAILAGNLKDQMLCERKKPVGSNILESRCETRREALARGERSRDVMQRMTSNNIQGCIAGAGSCEGGSMAASGQ